ncbi:MAG: MarR family transcriptional regulator [Paraburkholderia tropica]|uniref:MarR family winged helix-turn-helix transcriptional regulator n=1 Tax=Paraburkholderia tropica TaxID=92647 RepID=UPI000D76C500|nr:MarR family transcriptional regulator [Paraburkholderia tropica]
MTEDLLTQYGYLFLGSRLKRLAERLQADVVRVSQRNGLDLQPGHYTLLATIAEDGPKSIGALAQSLGLSQPAITKKASRLSELQLVEVTGSGEDGRRRIVALTEKGNEAMRMSRATVWLPVDAAVRQVVGSLSGPLLDQLSQIELALEEKSLADRAEEFYQQRTSE